MALQKEKEYINLKQWVHECKKRWGMKKATAKEHWRDFLGDDSIPRSKDQMGWLTMPALHVFKLGPKATSLFTLLAQVGWEKEPGPHRLVDYVYH